MQRLILAICFLTGCSQAPDLQKEKAVIISFLEMERKAHFEKNAAMFMSNFPTVCFR